MSGNLREQLERLPELLGAHVTLVLASLAAGMVVTVPLAWLAVRSPPLRGVVLGAASVLQTVPSLAMLALMVAALGLFGWPAAFIALTLYSVLPMLRNTVTSLTGTDPALMEAAKGVGMTATQTLLRVQLPLAAPVIVAGVRTATVWIVGIATLSTPVGADSLGNYIFSGLQTRNTAAVLTGVVCAAVLAVALDGLIRLIEVALARSSGRLALAGALGLVAVLTLGLAPLAVSRARRPSASDAGRTLTVGAKTFTEQLILARLIQGRLEAAGLAARVKEGLGSTVVFDALTRGDVDLYVDYTGTIWTNHMGRGGSADRLEVVREVSAWLRSEHGVRTLGALGFENAYALAMKRERAEALGLRTVEDLARVSASLSLGSDYEFFARPEWASLERTYGIEFAERRSFDPTLMYPAVNEGRVDVITAFSTDGRILAFDLATLEDDRHAFPPYDALLLASPRAAADSRVRDALAPLVGALTDARMRAANRIVDVDGGSLAEAVEFLDAELSVERGE